MSDNIKERYTKLLANDPDTFEELYAITGRRIDSLRSEITELDRRFEVMDEIKDNA